MMILKWIYSNRLAECVLDSSGSKWRVSVTTTMNYLVPKNAGNFLTGRETVSSSRRTLIHGVGTSRTICAKTLVIIMVLFEVLFRS
jgi:hypothetical protein